MPNSQYLFLLERDPKISDPLGKGHVFTSSLDFYLFKRYRVSNISDLQDLIHEMTHDQVKIDIYYVNFGKCQEINTKEDLIDSTSNKILPIPKGIISRHVFLYRKNSNTIDLRPRYRNKRLYNSSDILLDKYIVRTRTFQKWVAKKAGTFYFTLHYRDLLMKDRVNISLQIENIFGNHINFYCVNNDTSIEEIIDKAHDHNNNDIFVISRQDEGIKSWVHEFRQKFENIPILIYSSSSEEFKFHGVQYAHNPMKVHEFINKDVLKWRQGLYLKFVPQDDLNFH